MLLPIVGQEQMRDLGRSQLRFDSSRPRLSTNSHRFGVVRDVRAESRCVQQQPRVGQRVVRAYLKD